MKRRLQRLLLAQLFALCACPSLPPPAPQLSALQAQVFTPNCTFSSCHSSGGVAGSLVLEPGKSFANLVRHASSQKLAAQEGMLRVAPGDPDHSLIMLKLRGTSDARYGSHMPDTGQQLDQGDLDAIAEWIRLGAQND